MYKAIKISLLFVLITSATSYLHASTLPISKPVATQQNDGKDILAWVVAAQSGPGQITVRWSSDCPGPYTVRLFDVTAGLVLSGAAVVPFGNTHTFPNLVVGNTYFINVTDCDFTLSSGNVTVTY